MHPKTYYLLLLIALATIGFCAFGILNTQVSCKYETHSPDNCISHVTGTDLCKSLQTLKILTALGTAGYLALLLFRKKIIKSNPDFGKD